jgi:DNA-binding IclR family transcriptional regulator
MVHGGDGMSDFFVNDKYRVLECMAQRQISVGGANVVKLSQQEIAGILGFTKTKVNAIIRELKEHGYITQVNVRGKYALTEKANAEIEKMQGREATI